MSEFFVFLRSFGYSKTHLSHRRENQPPVSQYRRCFSRLRASRVLQRFLCVHYLLLPPPFNFSFSCTSTVVCCSARNTATRSCRKIDISNNFFNANYYCTSDIPKVWRRMSSSSTTTTTCDDADAKLPSSAKSATTSWNPTKFLDLPKAIVAHYVPPLNSVSYKGSSGRIGILGGSERYTGAPYYAAMASLKVGSDLAFLFCAREAAIPIKCYSPELMVASVYDAEEFGKALSLLGEEGIVARDQLVLAMVTQVTSMFDRMHVLIVGPGLGRCPLVMRATAEIVRQALAYSLPLVLDADALFLLTQEPYKDLLKVSQHDMQRTVVLTPNAMELKRLTEAIADCPVEDDRRRIQESYRGVIVVHKGQYDRVYFLSSLFNANSTSNFGTSLFVSPTCSSTLVCEEVGGLKRSGGLGDILAGSIGTFLAWNQLTRNKNNDITNSNLIEQLSGKEKLVPCWAACCIVKLATKAAYSKMRRAMTAPDVLEEIGDVVDKVITSQFD